MKVEARTRPLILSLVSVVTIAVVEGSAGFLTNSLALLTDAFHAVFDAVMTMSLLLMARLSLKPADAEHMYGHGKLDAMGGFIGGLILFIVALTFIWEAMNRLFVSTPPVNPGLIGVGAVLYALSVDVVRVGVLRRAVKRVSGATLKAAFLDAFTDLASTLVALTGVLLASYGVFKGDAGAALVLGVILGYLSSKLAYENALELVDTAPPGTVRKVRRAIERTEGVTQCRDLKVRRVGDKVFTEATIALRGDMSFDEAHLVTAGVERSVRDAIAGECSVTVHFEPEWVEAPIEAKVRRLSTSVRGVRGVHDLSLSKTNGGVYVTLHVKVKEGTKLREAHEIADRVEARLRQGIAGVRHITLHLEPAAPEYVTSKPVQDKSLEESVREMVRRHPAVKGVGKIVTYTSEGVLRIDVHCFFESSIPIEAIHETVSDLEKRVKSRLPTALVTIHSEPEPP